MRRNAVRARRGSCLLWVLVGFAVLGLVLVIAGIAAMLTSGAGEAVTRMEAQIKAFADRAQAFEAPGGREVELSEGGGLVIVSPNGKVGDKVIGMPSPSTDVSVTITDPDGQPVKFDATQGQRSASRANQPFQLIGVFETAKSGTYRIEAKTSDGSAVALSVVAGSKDQIDAMLGTVGAMAQGGIGFCGAICGVGLLLGFGIPALVIRARARKAPPDPLAEA